MRPRRPRLVDERADTTLFIAFDPLVAGLATDAGVLTQRNEWLLVLQVPRDELHTFIHGVSLIPWHAAACRSLLPMSSVRSVTDVLGPDRKFRLTAFSANAGRVSGAPRKWRFSVLQWRGESASAASTEKIAIG
jgi:hypothetical protein